MKHEDGYCDRCGAELETAQLTVDGLELCETCSSSSTAPKLEDKAQRGAYSHGA